jgi:hypothetical protein
MFGKSFHSFLPAEFGAGAAQVVGKIFLLTFLF